MIYLRKFNENSEYDLAFAISKITNAFNEEAVDKMLRAEILNWSDSLDAYKHLNNNEAEDVVLCRLIDWYENEYGNLTKEQREEIYTALKEIYQHLNF